MAYSHFYVAVELILIEVLYAENCCEKIGRESGASAVWL